MDLAYDHIAERSYTQDRAATPTPTKDSSDAPTPTQPARQNLQTEFQETFKAFSNSPWGARLGGLWGNVRKQGESYYEEARKEAEAASTEAMKGFTGLKETLASRTRSLSFSENEAAADAEKTVVIEDKNEMTADEAKLQENETFLERFKVEAAKRLKEVQKAEDAADEALLRFGTNIRNFLRDAVAVSPPEDPMGTTEVLFESKDPSSGKRVIHTSRFDAQLHVIHSNLKGFSEDPSGSGDEWKAFQQGFDIEKKTDAIAADLDKYTELRHSMEKLVPETVEYKDFWTRYYFLRHVVEAQEERRRELLKATANETEEVAWDEDSDDEDNNDENTSSSTPQTHSHLTATTTTRDTTTTKQPTSRNTNDSTSSIHTINNNTSSTTTENLKPEGRRSHDEKSVADSDASYDLVSGATSRAPPSPKGDGDDDHHRKSSNTNHTTNTPGRRVEESDEEEDWE